MDRQWIDKARMPPDPLKGEYQPKMVQKKNFWHTLFSFRFSENAQAVEEDKQNSQGYHPAQQEYKHRTQPPFEA